MKTPTLTLRLTRVLSLFVAGSSLHGATVFQVQQQKWVEDPNQYAVYRALPKQSYFREKVNKYMFALATNSKSKSTFVGWRPGFAPNGATSPQVDFATSKDFDCKNAESSELLTTFTLPVPYSVESAETLRKFFVNPASGEENSEGWHEFYKHYPGAPGIISFTRAGFDAEKDQTLGYVRSQGGFGGGSGRFFALSNRDHTWTIEKEIILWLS
jgi:hypothetical protein